jgi:hypothetical protein
MASEDTHTNPPKIGSFQISEKKGRFEINAQINIMGRDLQVNLLGGSGHIGAVGMGEPRPSLKDPSQRSATSSVFTFVSHKEDGIAKFMAERLAKDLNRKVVVAAGIHWDELDPDEIEQIKSMCEEVTGKITRKMTEE